MPIPTNGDVIMTDETRKLPEQAQAAPEPECQPMEDLPFLHIPAPPIPGKTAWSLSPWLPE